MPNNPIHPVSSEPQESLKADLSAEISRLANLQLDKLRSAWSLEFRKELPKGASRDLLLRTLVWRLQEKVFGGHDRATLKLLDAYARGQGNDPIFRRLKSGTVLVREYQGVRHTVTIAQDGFIWHGKSQPPTSRPWSASWSLVWPALPGQRPAGRFYRLTSLG
jgi:hypothetical protein